MPLVFTYVASELSDTTSTGHDRYVVRMLIGDTSTSRAQNLDDAEVDYFASGAGNLNLAAANAAEALGAKYLEAANSKKVGDLSIDKSKDEGDRLYRLAKSLRRRATAGATPIVGGVLISDKQDREADSDRTSPSFYRGRGDYPGTSQPGGNSSVDDWAST